MKHKFFSLFTFICIGGCTSDMISLPHIEPLRPSIPNESISSESAFKINIIRLKPEEQTRLVDGQPQLFQVDISITGATNESEDWELKTYFNGITNGPAKLKAINKNGAYDVSYTLSWKIIPRQKNQNVLVELIQVKQSKSRKTTERSLVRSINRDYSAFCNLEDFRIVRKLKSFIGRCYYL